MQNSHVMPFGVVEYITYVLVRWTYDNQYVRCHGVSYTQQDAQKEGVLVDF